MKFISHRGLWNNSQEKNTFTSFERSFDLNFGVETDVRDLMGNLVISHDPPLSKVQDFDNFLKLLNGKNLPLALNIKSDGLFELLADKFRAHKELSSAFVFDMSVPDLIKYSDYGIPFFTRLSEYEPYPVYIDKASGIWLDAFVADWYNVDLIRSYLDKNYIVSIVSPELHGRDNRNLWELLHAHSDLRKSNNLWLCTDFPEKAQNLLGV